MLVIKDNLAVNLDQMSGFMIEGNTIEYFCPTGPDNYFVHAFDSEEECELLFYQIIDLYADGQKVLVL